MQTLTIVVGLVALFFLLAIDSSGIVLVVGLFTIFIFTGLAKGAETMDEEDSPNIPKVGLANYIFFSNPYSQKSGLDPGRQAAKDLLDCIARIESKKKKL